MEKVGVVLKRILLLFLLIVGIYIGFTNMDKLSWIPFGNHPDQITISNDVSVIKMDTTGINTKIIPENRNSIQVKLNGKGNAVLKKNGDTIRVQYSRKWFDWFSFFNQSKLIIYIPDHYNRNMDIRVGTGNMNFNGRSIKKPFKLNHLSVNIVAGNMDLKNIKVNQFEHNETSGSVNIDYLVVKNSTFHLKSGGLHLNHFDGKMDAEIFSGNYSVKMNQLENVVKVTVYSGNVKLDLPNNAGFTLKSHINSGNISNSFPLKNKTETRHYLEGKYGSGKHHIHLQMFSGNIKIY